MYREKFKELTDGVIRLLFELGEMILAGIGNILEWITDCWQRVESSNIGDMFLNFLLWLIGAVIIVLVATLIYAGVDYSTSKTIGKTTGVLTRSDIRVSCTDGNCSTSYLQAFQLESGEYTTRITSIPECQVGQTANFNVNIGGISGQRFYVKTNSCYLRRDQ